MTALRPFDGLQGPQAQGPAKAKVIELVEIEDSTELNADIILNFEF